LAEQTLVIVKPDAVKRNLAEEILSRFKKKGFSISKLKTFNFTVEMAEQFYSVHSSKPFLVNWYHLLRLGRLLQQ